MSYTIVEDVAQKDKQHEEKHRYFKSAGIDFQRYPLPVGDYILMNEKVADVIYRKKFRGIPVKKMDFLGTYNVCIDTKYDIQELVMDICGKQHERFRDECILAQNNGIQLYILVENRGGQIGNTDIWNKTVHNLSELASWKNPRLFVMQKTNEISHYNNYGKPIYKRVQKYPKATRGVQLMKSCLTMEQKYGVKFLFCTPSEAGKVIESILVKGERP